MSPDDMSSWATQTLLPTLAAAVTWAATHAGGYLAHKRHAAEIANAIVRLDHIVHAVVRELEQRAVGVLRQVTKDAGLSDTVKDMLRKAALSKTKHLLGDRQLARLAKSLDVKTSEVDDFLGTRIEAAVHGLAHERRLQRARNAAAAETMTATRATKGR